ncbi:MAG: hypothetical protein ACR2J6_03830 [Thermoleophilaceae bacterium]
MTEVRRLARRFDAASLDGGHVHDERGFGDLTLPRRVSVGWWFGTPRYEPFVEATVLDAEVGA